MKLSHQELNLRIILRKNIAFESLYVFSSLLPHCLGCIGRGLNVLIVVERENESRKIFIFDILE